MIFVTGLILALLGFLTVRHLGLKVRRVYNLADHVGCGSFWIGAGCMGASVLMAMWSLLP